MFEIVIASCEVPCAAIVAGVKVLAIVTFGRFTTVRVAVAGPGLVEPCVVESAPAGIVFTYAPAASLVTLTVTVHVAPAPRLAAESVTFVSPAFALTVPVPQVVDAFGVGATLSALALSIKRRLDTGPSGERSGFTARPLFEGRLQQSAELVAALATLAPAARPLPSEGAAPGGDFKPGSGSFGGGGASDSF